MDIPRFSGTEMPQFCARCGKPVVSGDSWGGRCLWTDCEGRICASCFGGHKLRFCESHALGGRKGRRELMMPKEQDLPDVTPGIRALHEARMDGREGRARYNASEYWRWLSSRMNEAGPIDWTPRGMLRNPKSESLTLGNAYCVRVKAGSILCRKVALSLTVIPFDWSHGFDRAAVNAAVIKAARGAGGHGIVVLVGDGVPMEAVGFVTGFSDSSVSLYLAEPGSRHLSYNARDPVTRAYSEWLSQSRQPRRFREKAAATGDIVDGRRMVTAKGMAAEFGFRESDMDWIIRSCGFLYPAGEGKYSVG